MPRIYLMVDFYDSVAIAAILAELSITIGLVMLRSQLVLALQMRPASASM